MYWYRECHSCIIGIIKSLPKCSEPVKLEKHTSKKQMHRVYNYARPARKKFSYKAYFQKNLKSIFDPVNSSRPIAFFHYYIYLYTRVCVIYIYIYIYIYRFTHVLHCITGAFELPDRFPSALFQLNLRAHTFSAYIDNSSIFSRKAWSQNFTLD